MDSCIGLLFVLVFILACVLFFFFAYGIAAGLIAVGVFGLLTSVAVITATQDI